GLVAAAHLAAFGGLLVMACAFAFFFVHDWVRASRWRRRRTVGLALAVLLAGFALDARPHAQPSQAATDAELERLLAERVDVQKKSLGTVVGIVSPAGRRIFARGTLDDGAGAVDGDTVFEIGSVTKVFTALLLADMVQRGEVALADPLARYLPEGVT